MHLVTVIAVTWNGGSYMGRFVTYGIKYNCRHFKVEAATFYSACKKVMVQSGYVGKFYVGRLFDTSGKKVLLIDYLITINKNKMIHWLKDRYNDVSTVNKRCGWVLKGGRDALNLQDCIDNMSETVGEPSIVEVVDYSGRYYADKFRFDVIALKD